MLISRRFLIPFWALIMAIPPSLGARVCETGKPCGDPCIPPDAECRLQPPDSAQSDPTAAPLRWVPIYGPRSLVPSENEPDASEASGASRSAESGFQAPESISGHKLRDTASSVPELPPPGTPHYRWDGGRVACRDVFRDRAAHPIFCQFSLSLNRHQGQLGPSQTGGGTARPLYEPRHSPQPAQPAAVPTVPGQHSLRPCPSGWTGRMTDLRAPEIGVSSERIWATACGRGRVPTGNTFQAETRTSHA